MKAVYICSPFRADTEAEKARNIAYAREMTREAIRRGLAPITPHLYLPDVLNDDGADERSAGLAAGLELLRRCDTLWLCARYGVSIGMTAEIACAEERNIPIIRIGRSSRSG